MSGNLEVRVVAVAIDSLLPLPFDTLAFALQAASAMAMRASHGARASGHASVGSTALPALLSGGAFVFPTPTLRYVILCVVLGFPQGLRVARKPDVSSRACWLTSTARVLLRACQTRAREP